MRLPLLLFFMVGLLMLLWWRFPYAAATTEQQMRIVYLLLMLMLLGGGSGMMRRMNSSQVVRGGLMWLAIILLLVLGYSFRRDIGNSRIAAELVPSHIQVDAAGALSVDSAADGHFYMEADINGVTENFMIDTGASDIVLSPRAATAAGFDIDTLNYSRVYHTANGTGSGAPVRLKTLQVGAVTLRDLPASVNKADMEASLLGMAFLTQFQRFSIDGNRLTLVP